MRLKKNLLALLFVLVALPAYAQNAPGGLSYFSGTTPSLSNLNSIVAYINNALGYSGNSAVTQGSSVSIATGTVTTNSPALNITQTWNNAASTFTGILSNITNTASNSASKLIDLQVGGVSQFNVLANGSVGASGFLSSVYGSGINPGSQGINFVGCGGCNASIGMNGGANLGLYIGYSALFNALYPNIYFSVYGPGINNATAGLNYSTIFFNMSSTTTHATGNLTLEQDFRVTGTTQAFASASTITDAAVFSVDGPDLAGANATITSDSAILVPSLALTGTITNSYGLKVSAASGATNNYAAVFLGGNVGIGTSSPSGQFALGNAAAHAGQATCWTTNGQIGYCTTVVGSTGACTCTGL